METDMTRRPAACRPDTLSHRSRAVERVIQAMRERLDEALSLHDLARIARMSPFHFNRVFGQITGIPPSQFLAALRLEAAKRLLLLTDRSVTDVCFDVGYNSLGSFITRFTQMVGRSPRHLRGLRRTGESCRQQPPHPGSNPRPPGEAHGVLHGRVSGPESFLGRVFVGLFPTPIPQARPVACTVLSEPGAFVIERIPDGVYHVLALGVPGAAGLRAYALCEDTLRGRAGPVVVHGSHSAGPTAVSLRPARLTDAPILVALPFLLHGPCPAAVLAPLMAPSTAEAPGAGPSAGETQEVAGQDGGGEERRAI